MSRYALLSAAALALAGCNDAPTAPAAPTSSRMPEPPNATLIVRSNPVNVTLQIVDQGGPYDTGVPGTTVQFTSSTGASMTVVDNSAQDADARPGFYKVSMGQANWYKATVTAATSHFSLDAATKTVSAFVTPTLVSMGGLTLMRKPGLFVQLYYNNALIAGQTIKVTGPNGFSVQITDGGANDRNYDGSQNGSDGKFSLEVPVTGSYTVCTMTSPQAYWDAGCQGVWAGMYFMEYGVSMTYKQVWFVPKF